MNYTLIDHKEADWKYERGDGIETIPGHLNIHCTTNPDYLTDLWARLSSDNDLELTILLDGVDDLDETNQDHYDELYRMMEVKRIAYKQKYKEEQEAEAVRRQQLANEAARRAAEAQRQADLVTFNILKRKLGI